MSNKRFKAPPPGRVNPLPRALCRSAVAISVAACSSDPIAAPEVGSVEQPAMFENAGTLKANPTVCFASHGNWGPIDPTWASEIQGFVNQWANVSGLKLKWTGNCAAPSTGKDTMGNNVDIYPETVRILVQHAAGNPAVGAVVDGLGCAATMPNSWYGTFPNDNVSACRWNMWIGHEVDVPATDPSRPFTNNYLHEFGHVMGLQHEHIRKNADAACGGDTLSAFGVEITNYYDRLSVMSYTTGAFNASGVWVRKAGCGDIPGNYDHTGLSDGDIIAAQILYPDTYYAQALGRRVTWAGQSASFRSAWQDRGVNLTTMMKSPTWRFDNSIISTGTTSAVSSLKTGKHAVRFTYSDNWGSAYDGTFAVEVLPTKAAYLKRMASTIGSAIAL